MEQKVSDVINKLDSLFNENKKEEEYFQNFNQTIHENKSLLKGLQVSLQSKIEAMEKEMNDDGPCEAKSLSPNEKETTNQIENAKRNKENLILDLQKSMADLKINNDQLKKLTAEKENISGSNLAKMEKLRYDIDLYTNITGIRWHYDCELDERKGYIAKRGILKPFSLNTNKHSAFFIANYLWDLMEQS